MKKIQAYFGNTDSNGKRIYLFFCLILLLVVIFFLGNQCWGLYDDIWETAAAIREISINPLNPSNPMIELPGNTSPRFIPYTVFWGLFQRVSQINIYTILGIMGLINYLIFIFGLYLFISNKFKSKTLPTYVLFSMLFIWGSGYGWANAYQLELFLENLPHVGFFAFGLTFHALYFLDRFCLDNKFHHLIVYTLLSVIIFISHPITGLFCFVAAFADLLSYRNLKRTLLLQIVPIIVFGLSFLWPYFKYWDVFINGTTQEWFQSRLFSNHFTSLGTVLIGFVIAGFNVVKKKHPFLLYGLSICLFVYVFSGLVNIPIGGRFIFFTAFFLHVFIADYIQRNNLFNINSIKQSIRADGLLFIVVCIFIIPSLMCRAYGMGIHVRRIVDRPFKIHRYSSPVSPFRFLSEYITDSNVVMVNIEDGWVIPAVTGARIVAPWHSSPLAVDEISQRTNDVQSFFHGMLTYEERMVIIDKYRVTHVVLNLDNEKEWDLSLVENMDSIAEEVVREGRIVVFIVREHELIKQQQKKDMLE